MIALFITSTGSIALPLSHSALPYKEGEESAWFNFTKPVICIFEVEMESLDRHSDVANIHVNSVIRSDRMDCQF